VNDAVVERVNRKLPDGSKWIDSAELIARKLRNFNDGTADIPKITKHMRLPAFQYGGSDHTRGRDRKFSAQDVERDRLQRTEEAIVVATGAARERGCPPWVVLGVKAVEARGIRAT